MGDNYYISNKGRFRSGENNSTIRYGTLHPDGYYRIKQYKTSRLLNIALGLLDPKSDDVVDHINEDRSDNTIDNLEVVSQKENRRRSVENKVY